MASPSGENSRLQMNEMIPWIRSDTCISRPDSMHRPLFHHAESLLHAFPHQLRVGQKGKQQHRAEKQEAESKQYQKSPVHTPYRRFHHGQDKNPLCPPFSIVYFALFPTDCPPFFFTLCWELLFPSLFTAGKPTPFLSASHFHPRARTGKRKTTYSCIKETLLVLANQFP